MADHRDVRGYYAVLGIEAGSSIQVVKAAFRKLAMDCHPDRMQVSDGGKRFREISEAYEVLSEPAAKAAYDQLAEVPPPPPPRPEQEKQAPQTASPIACEVCAKVTVQPRRLAFWRITSVLLASHKTPIQKIYCRSCATKEQWRSTLWTSLLGWWGVPWGPIWSIGHGATNALGGTREQSVDEALMWQNAIAFATSGQGKLAVGLANILRKSENADLAKRAAELIAFFAERGVDVSTTLKDAWTRSIPQTLGLLLAAFAVPGAVLAFMLVPGPSTNSSTWAQAPAPIEAPAADSVSTDPSSQAVVEPASSAAQQPIQTCKSPPVNGQTLMNRLKRAQDGHAVVIENGTEGDAITKLRNASSGKALASFFIASGKSASFERIPDGTYRIEYAFGGSLKKDCKHFVEVTSAGEFPDAETLTTRYEEEFDGTRIIHGRLSYTLYSVPGGNVAPNSISAAQFEKD